MDYVLSHLPVLFFASLFIAACAITWWLLLDLNARRKAQRAAARRKEAEEARSKEASKE